MGPLPWEERAFSYCTNEKQFVQALALVGELLEEEPPPNFLEEEAPPNLIKEEAPLTS